MKKIIPICIAIFLTATVITAKAQVAPHADHIALYVNDLTKSTAFYKDIMQLPEIPEPFHDGKHIWLRTGEHSQLHLIQGAKEVVQHDINSHFAYSVPDLQVFMKHLDALHIKYGNWGGTYQAVQARPDGVKQIYLQDPDNYWIEINDDKF